MEETMVFNEMLPGEEESVSALVGKVFDEFVAPGYTEEGNNVFRQFISPNEIRSCTQKGSLFLVARARASITGVIAVRNTNHISLFFVDKAFHRKGIASKLLSLAIEKSLLKDPGLTEFTVNSSPYAVKAYERLGFKAQKKEQEENGIRYTPMKKTIHACCQN